jgi:hypothetical protein
MPYGFWFVFDALACSDYFTATSTAVVFTNSLVFETTLDERNQICFVIAVSPVQLPWKHFLLF